MPPLFEDFVARWSKVQASERATSQSFLNELCDLLQLQRPDNTDAYQFERPVPFIQPDGKRTTKFIDLYKRGCFVLEAKKYDELKAETDELALLVEESPATRKNKVVRGSGRWDDAMFRAFGQAERYAHHLPNDEPAPLFLIIVDVGHVIELYADFTQKGRNYVAFPDSRSHRVPLTDLGKPQISERLRLVWTDPAQLDPSKRTIEVTLTVARHLAALATSLEKTGHPPKLVAEFLCRCLFCMFAEDVGLLKKDSFKAFLESMRGDPGAFVTLMEALFKEMDKGASLSMILRQKLLRFNGGLFAEQTVLPVNGTQLGLLIEAAKCEWRHVEPAIFGTLLEQALEADERGRLGAHFTPRSYVERLVLPTVIEPLRADWRAVRDEAVILANRGDLKKARGQVRAFQKKLCGVRVLDPACGSGNFLYVTLEHMKRLEGEVLDLLRQFGDDDAPAVTVDPHQFFGMELNGRAVPIAELVLWIGYLQWHFRVHGNVLPAEPVLKKFDNIVERDAVLAYDGHPQNVTQKMAEANLRLPGLPDNWRDLVDKHTKTIFVWDRCSYKTDPLTGREVPDGSKRITLLAYKNPRPAAWPEADFVVGNPPFKGAARLREELGDGYAETLRAVYPEVAESADFVMYWWHKAAELARAGKIHRFGFITTNSLRQTFARRVVQHHLSAKPPLSLLFAIPDHPWVDPLESEDKKAAVRIAMTVGSPGEHAGDLLTVIDEQEQPDGAASVTFSTAHGRIQADLTIGADVAGTVPLKSNEGLSSPGVKLHGSGFIVTPDEAKALGLGSIDGLGKHIRPYRNGRDLTETPRGVMIIDLFGLREEQVRIRFPKVYQHVLSNVKPERDQNHRAGYRENWWIHGEPRSDLRPALAGLPRYIATVETAKHRIVQFLDATILPDNRLIVFALADAFHLGVLNSSIHTVFAGPNAAGAMLEDRPVYSKSRCFDPFPFPECTEKQKERIRKIAEELDAHRKRAQEKHRLGLTDIYNVLEKLRAGEELTPRDKEVHDAALISTLKQLHDDLDKAVADAYGWRWPMTDAEILEYIVALNTARAAEEKAGVICWLRPEFQAKGELQLEGGSAHLDKPQSKPAKKPRKQPWPAALAERIKAVEIALAQAEKPQTAATLAKVFARAKEADVKEILDSLYALGRARPGDVEGTFVR
jgi:SAM-dependent methyltransferase